MKIKCIICIVFLVFSMAAGGTIQAQNEAAGYVISVEGEKVYIDLAAGKVKPGDKVAVYSKEGYFIHPVTKKRLKREPSQVASLEVVKVYTDYSLAKAVPAQSLSKVEVGMSVMRCHSRVIRNRRAMYMGPRLLRRIALLFYRLIQSEQQTKRSRYLWLRHR
mgnify:CR=1 FL=1